MRRLPFSVRSALVLMIIGAALTGVPAAAQTTPAPLTPVDIVGGPGHAGMYAWGVASLADGRVLLGDYWNLRVAAYNPDGSFDQNVMTSVTRGSGYGQHQAPYGVAVDPVTNDVYVGDVDGGANVDKYLYDAATDSWSFGLQFGSQGTGANRFLYPASIAVGSDRLVFVADHWSDNVAVMRPNGTELFAFGGSATEAGSFTAPRGIAVCPGCAAKGNDLILITDNFAGKVHVFRHRLGGRGPASIRFVRSFGRDGTAPGEFSPGHDLRGVAVDPATKRVYVVDASSGWVNAYSLKGTYLGVRFGGFGADRGSLAGGGRHLAVASDGRIWVGHMPAFRAVIYDFGTGGYAGEAPWPAEPPPPLGFNQPRDVAIGPDGEIVVADTHNWRMLSISPSGTTQLAEWGTRGGGPFAFNYQKGVAVDQRNGDVIVGDTDNNYVSRFTADGGFLWRVGGIGSGLGRFKRPHDVDVAPDGRIYVADGRNARVQVLDEDGTALFTFGGAGTAPGKFSFAQRLDYDDGGTPAMLADDAVWVADPELGRVTRFSRNGDYVSHFGSLGNGTGQLLYAGGVAADQHCVYVADADRNRIVVFSRSGAFVAEVGGGGVAPGRMFRPQGLELAPDGHLWVVEQLGERVQEFSVTDGGACAG
jgi:tripartite motif-containing protein 71